MNERGSTMVGMWSSHTVQDWRDAFEGAEEAGFDPTDTREGTPGEIGELGAMICDEAYGREGLAGIAEGISADKPETVTAEMIYAAIDALDGDMRQQFAMADLLKVIASFRGETGGDFRILAEGYADENGYKLVGLTTDDEFERWYLENGVAPGEVCGEQESGGDLMWFNKNHW